MIEENLKKLVTLCDEIISFEELKKLIENNNSHELNHYIGFEISGKPHIGTGLMTMQVVKILQDLGVNCQIWLADWHAWINDKLGGDKEFISEIGLPYFMKNMIAAAIVCGVDIEKLTFRSGSAEYQNINFWETFIDVSKNVSLARVQRSISVLGRNEGESVDFAKLVYPPLQVADIFYLKCHIAHAGMDQRKAHVIALDCALNMKQNPLMFNGEKIKPICIHQHLLLGLNTPPKNMIDSEEITHEMKADLKMSKSKPNSAVFLNDSEDEIHSKIKAAYCPEGIVKLNPILDWAKYICFNLGDKTLEIIRKEEWGGNITYSDYQSLEKDYIEKKLHPMDLKSAVGNSISKILLSAREYLDDPKIKEMEIQITKKVTR
jgi:tyrosyl-tRNA synthetase